MKNIMVLIQPFTEKQDISVYEGGEKIDATSVASVDDIVPQLLTYIKKYNDIEQVNFVGAKHYNKIFGNSLQEKIMTEFENQTISIKYI